VVGDYKPSVEHWSFQNPAGGNIVPCNHIPDHHVTPFGDCAFRFGGVANQSGKLSQKVKLKNKSFAPGDSLNLGFIFRGKNAATALGVAVLVKYSDGTDPAVFSLQLGSQQDYGYWSGSIVLASSAVSKIQVRFTNQSTAGKVLY
jgi:hypothetical protein